MDQAEQCQQPGPGAVAAVHQIVAMAGSIVAQFLEQAAQSVIFFVQRVRRHQIALLGIEHEYEPHQDGHEPGVEPLRIVLGKLRNRRCAVGSSRIGRHETAQQLVQGTEDLTRQPSGDQVLRLATRREQAAKTVARLGAEHPMLAEQ